MWRSRLLALGGFFLAALSACAQPPVADKTAPRRIVSLDYCADQYLLRFAKREDILALSIDARKPFSYMRDEAVGLPQVRPRAGDVLALEPDLVIRSYGGGPDIGGFLERAGVSVVQIGFPGTIAEVRQEALRIGTELGQPDEARAVVEDMDRRLARITKGEGRETLYITPGGVAAGEDTMVDDLLKAAGLANFQTRMGWNPIPLERLAYDRPQQIALGFAKSNRDRIDTWSAARHPIAQAQLKDLPVIPIEGAWTACGGWFLVEAVEALAAVNGPSEKMGESAQ
jgi:iron complex transport system substrate-binding protein